MSRTTLSVDSISPPGFNAPAAGFEQPFAMLAACHERIERTLRLLLKLVDHVATRGVDAQARSAASDVLRYFNIAAPLHHQDEELHVFPQLIARGDVALSAQVRTMQLDHRQMEKLWSELRPCLVALTTVDGAEIDVLHFGSMSRAFANVYASHLQTEEEVLFPAAAKLKTLYQLQDMDDEMRRRRTTS